MSTGLPSVRSSLCHPHDEQTPPRWTPPGQQREISCVADTRLHDGHNRRRAVKYMLMICDDESVILSPAEVHALPHIQARGAEVDARGSGAAARGSSQAVMPARPRTGPGGPPVTA